MAWKGQGPVRSGPAPGLIRKRFSLFLQVDGRNEGARVVAGRTPRRSQNELREGAAAGSIDGKCRTGGPAGRDIAKQDRECAGRRDLRRTGRAPDLCEREVGDLCRIGWSDIAVGCRQRYGTRAGGSRLVEAVNLSP